MKKIIIMGATSGLGLGVAEIYARAGWRVGVCGRNKKRLDEFSSKYPDNTIAAQIDITSSEAPDQLMLLISRLGGMDIYFHASGICFENPELDLLHDINTVRTNVLGFTAMINTAFNFYKAHNIQGQIAAISSVASTRGIADLAAYSASKSFNATYLEALQQLSRREGYGISITDIRPGWTATPLLTDGREYPMCMNPEKVVCGTVRAIIDRKSVAVIDWRWNLMVKAWRLLPRALWTRIPYHTSSKI